MTLTDITQQGEEWKPIDGYNGKYEVSNLGRVYSHKRNKLMKPSYRKGYTFVLLSNAPHGENSFSIHRLVCAAFIGKSDLHVDHINGIKDDNRLSNLQYVSHRQNHILYHERLSGKKAGVRKRETCDRWEASGSIMGEYLFLGIYKTELEAIAAREGFLRTEAALNAIAKIKEAQ